ncbi:MAG: hypothetical protein JXI43_06920 [Tissierellales bacterium]|nr:hypothetical protein [Tissierellales bacterium]
MRFTCIEIQGAIYQPEQILSLGKFWIISATKNAGVLPLGEFKVILATQMGRSDMLKEAKRFMQCYQFLFLRSEVYFFSSLQQDFPSFIENGKDINDIADRIYKKYGTDGPIKFKLAFNDIDAFHTQLPNKVSFVKFYNCFIKKYCEDDNFRNIIDLFLYTIGSKPKYYNNLFQKISQLQTVFETILGRPEQEIQSCGKEHNKEDWKSFLTRELKEKGIENEHEINLIIKIKNTLNWSARVKYTHYAQQLNTSQLFMKDIKNGRFDGQSTYTTNFENILNGKLEEKDWAGIDWENIYFFYQTIIKRLIYIEYLKNI